MRVFKIVLFSLAGWLALLVAALAVFLLVARTNWGGDKLLSLVLPRVNANLAGRIEARHLRLSWTSISLEGARLRDPEGHIVAEVARVAVRWSPLALLHKHLEVRQVSLQQPTLFFTSAPNGESNLQRALASRSPKPKPNAPSKPTSASPWRIEGQRLEIVDGLLDLRLPGEGAIGHWRARELNGDLSARYDGRTDGFALQVRLRAKTSAPLREPVRVGLAAQGTLSAGPSLQGEGELRWGKSALRFSGRQSGDRSAQVHIDELAIQPELLRVFAPDEPLKASVLAHGDLDWNGQSQELRAELRAALGEASLHLTTAVELAPLAVRSLALRVRSLDLAQVVRDGPPSKLDLRLDGHARGRDLASLQGSVELEVPPGFVGGYRVGPVHARVEAERGQIGLPELAAVLPGLRITGSGQTSQKALRFSALIDVSDLGKTVAALTAGTSGPKARAAGRGRIVLSAAGPVASPSVHVGGQMSGLHWQELSIPNLRLACNVPNLAKPLASDVTLLADEIHYGPKRLRQAKVIYRASGPRFDAKIEVQPSSTFGLQATGAWNHSHSRVTLSSGQLRLWRARWDLVGPTVFALTSKTWRLSGLDLRGPGEQRVRVEVTRKGPALSADLWISQLQLALIPAGSLPAPLKPAGQLDVEAHVRGRLSDPVVDARLGLAHAEIDGLADISLMSNLHLLAHRASGDLQLDGGDGHLSGRFDVPALWPPPDESPLSAELTALDLDLALLLDKLAHHKLQLPSLSAKTCLKAQLQGTGARPDLAVDIRFRELQVAGTSMGQVVFQGTAHDGKPMSAQVQIHPVGASLGSGQVSLQAGLSLKELMRSQSIGPRLETVPLQFEAHLERVALAPLMALAGSSRHWAGEAAVNGSWQGTAAGGQGKLRLAGQGIVLDRYPPTDVVIELEQGTHQQQARARVSRKDATLAVLDLALYAPLSQLQRPQQWPHLPVRVHAVLGPLQVRREGLTPGNAREPSRTLQGRLQASADLTGTLGAPRLQAYARFEDVRLDETVVGSLDLAVSYGDGMARGNLDVLTADRGHWHSDALVVADLGYPGITRGLGQAPLRAHVQATNFDLTGFSGLTPNLRTLAGTISSTLEVSGTLDDPRPTGRFEWKNGELVLVGIGEYHKIHLLLQGDRDNFALDELKLESGSGSARITGRGQHSEAGGYDIDAQIHMDKLPLYAEGQRLATLSLDAKAQAQPRPQKTQVQVAISSARVALSDAKKKSLQSLARPGDVVLVEDGRPLNAEQKRKLAKLNTQLGLQAQGDLLASPEAKPAKVVVTLTAPRDIWINGEDANLELSLRPGFRVEINQEPQVFGTVEIRRGLVNLLGQRFDLKEGSNLVFAGAPDKPELDITTIYNDWQDNVVVEITAKGPPDKLQIGIRAPDRPDLTESQLYTLVVTGHLDVGGNTASANSRGDQAASLLGGVIAGQVQKVLAKKLPLDVLTIETGSDLGTARVEAGTYLTRKIYVGYVSRLGAMDPALLQNRNAVRLEYDLTSRWSFQGEYGDAMNGSADVLWTKHY